MTALISSKSTTLRFVFNLTLLHITQLEEKYMKTAKAGGLNGQGSAIKRKEHYYIKRKKTTVRKLTTEIQYKVLQVFCLLLRSTKNQVSEDE